MCGFPGQAAKERTAVYRGVLKNVVKIAKFPNKGAMYLAFIFSSSMLCFSSRKDLLCPV